jgi:hypothetical protein
MAQADAPNIIEVFGGIADKTGWHRTNASFLPPLIIAHFFPFSQQEIVESFFCRVNMWLRVIWLFTRGPSE